ncbi:MAG TPA: AAA domain-containing protein, partial [Chloroflexota bacterium]|nr:AAA domain-containing protein [Chloroflexota bacterium]
EAGAALADLQEYVSPEALTAGDEAEAPGGEDEVAGVGLDEAPLAALSARLQSWLTELQPLRRAVGLLSPHRRSPAGATGDLLAEAREALAVADLEAALLTASDVLRERFGHFYAALDTDWEQIRSALVWVTQLRAHFPGPVPAEFERIFLSGATTTSLHHPVRARFESALQEVEHLLEVLRPKLTSRTFTLGQQPVERAALAALAAWARAKRQSLPSLQEWIDYTQARAEAREAGLAGFVTHLLQERPPRDLWLRAFERQVYTLWLQQRYEQAPALAAFRRPAHEAAIKEFAELDRRFWQTAAPQVAARASQRRASATATTPSAPEAATLLREARKKRGFAPWRRLFADLHTLLPALKPCLLMSPATVAEYLGESSLTFDLVIFDEASQIPTAHAIGAIGRGRQVMGAGDVRQLPPGRAGAAGFLEDDDWLVEDDRLVDEAHATDGAHATDRAAGAAGAAGADEGAGIEAQPADRQSLLEACLAAGLPSKALRWHYRSRHEHLFAFSNRHFYERRLVTFLPPDQHEPAVELIHVEGGRADGRLPGVNRVEARRLAEVVLEQLERHPEQSLGVIALSAGQVIAIQSELEARVLTEPELAARLREAEEHGFFVKHVQDVQGDERDVILLSLGCGPDAGGRLGPDFGPLSLPAGERYLNVAVTRARRRVKVMASFHPHELDPSGASAGVRRLREYLEFAAGGPARLVEESTTGDDPSPFEAAVAEALRRRGLRVVPRVGLGPQPIDLGVKDPRSERYLLGIEGDGAAYAACQTARDRDRLRHEILESLGWTIHRVWSADWLADPAAEVERIMAALP